MVFDSIKKFSSLLAKNPKKAETILEIKKAYFDGKKYKNNVTSFDIYSKVLEKNISSVNEFKIKIAS